MAADGRCTMHDDERQKMAMNSKRLGREQLRADGTYTLRRLVGPFSALVLPVFVFVALAGAAGCRGGERAAPPASPLSSSTAQPLRILVSNDDGIEAPGITALADALSRVGEITVAAPLYNQSGVSHAMTSNKAVTVRKSIRAGRPWFAIDAMPATCVRMALDVLLPAKPDLVVAGINKGANPGVVGYYSATVAAAREASFQGIPAIAVNLQSGGALDYKLAADITAALVQAAMEKGFPRGVFLNVNIPALARGSIKGILVVPQDMRPAAETYENKGEKDGETIFWAAYKALDAGSKRTDVWALANGYVAVTPLGGDATDATALTRLRFLEKTAW